MASQPQHYLEVDALLAEGGAARAMLRAVEQQNTAENGGRLAAYCDLVYQELHDAGDPEAAGKYQDLVVRVHAELVTLGAQW